jgi:superfamily II DNA or RNA helicase
MSLCFFFYRFASTIDFGILFYTKKLKGTNIQKLQHTKMAHVYLMTNPDWEHERKNKFGYTLDPRRRLCDSHEQHSYKSTYIALYAIEETPTYKLPIKQYDEIFSIVCRSPQLIVKLERMYDCTLPCLRQLQQHLVEHGGSTEFILSSGIDIVRRVIAQEFPLIGLAVKEISAEKIQAICDESWTAHQSTSKARARLQTLDKDIVFRPVWNMRPYQKQVVDYATQALQKSHRIYIELATGAGKSVIAFALLTKMHSDTIVILSPRKIINKQNANDKYVSALGNYAVYDFSTSTSSLNKFLEKHPKRILIACTQSYKKVHEALIAHNRTNTTIWFDEAHWGVESWSDEFRDEAKQFLIFDNTRIEKRIYTSASPDKDFVEKHPDAFGELFSPIKVNELIREKWLCPIVPYVYCVDRDNVDVLRYMLKSFCDLKRQHGFSFHNEQENAFQMFYKHYNMYVANETPIRPYLLVGNEFRNESLCTISLPYEFMSIREFEKQLGSIGYVVDRYSMGYDFAKIDFLCFSDPRMSPKDIIQCIGRGTRPDGLCCDGRNSSKYLVTLLPVYVEQDKAYKYDRVKGVLKYLIHDVDCSYNDIHFEGRAKNKPSDADEDDRYDGNEDVKAAILDLLKGEANIWKLKDAINLLKRNNINDAPAYDRYIIDHPELGLPTRISTAFNEFKWVDTYIHNPFYDKQECIEKLHEMKETHEDKMECMENDEKTAYLHSVDNKIPNRNLWAFYGGAQEEYVVF